MKMHRTVPPNKTAKLPLVYKNLRVELERYNAKLDREGPSKTRRENLTIGGLFATAAFTLALAAFSLWQVIEARRTYDPIQQSADAAKKSADAAQTMAEAALKQANEAHEQTITTRSQVRANISNDPFGLNRYFQNAMLMGWRITPHWRNSGPTDALNVRTVWGWRYVPGHVTGLGNIADCPQFAFGDQTPFVVQAGHPFAQLAQDLQMANLLQASAENGAIYVGGLIEYNDIFPDDPLHTVDWCSRMIPNDIDKDVASYVAVKEIIR